MESVSNQFGKGLSALGLRLSASTQVQLLEFLSFLQKWNKTHNLTAITDVEQMVTHHLLDSLSLAPFVKGQHILDVGTGAGFPGIPLALTFPDKHFTLLDSRGKKTAFLLQAVATFKITNVTVVQARVEAYQAPRCFDVIVCRAFGTIADILEKTEHLICPEGEWLLMKGEYPEAELKGIDKPYQVKKLSVPGLSAERQVVIVSSQRKKQ